MTMVNFLSANYIIFDTGILNKLFSVERTLVVRKICLRLYLNPI
jgi:hypothetical protein